MKKLSLKEIAAGIAGVMIGGACGYILLPVASPYEPEDSHADEYHIHADFHIQVYDETLDLGTAQFMTTAEQHHHENAHLHDGDGDVLHMHAENISFVEFLGSINIKLSDDCITLDKSYCTDEFNQLAMYVNDQLYNEKITEYVPVDGDRVLVYFGSNDPDPEVINSYLESVPSDACFYSGTCPERGVAPPESCGLTCEL